MKKKKVAELPKNYRGITAKQIWISRFCCFQFAPKPPKGRSQMWSGGGRLRLRQLTPPPPPPLLGKMIWQITALAAVAESEFYFSRSASASASASAAATAQSLTHPLSLSLSGVSLVNTLIADASSSVCGCQSRRRRRRSHTAGLIVIDSSTSHHHHLQDTLLLTPTPFALYHHQR